MAKTKVALLFGGTSSEHEISLISAAAVAENLAAANYEVLKIGITKKGRWLLFPGDTAAMRDGSWEYSPDCIPAHLSPDATTRGIVLNHAGRFETLKPDVVFPVLHGKGGEDGTVQGLLDLAGIPYVGCGVLASANCMDKITACRLFEQCGIPHTPWMAVHRDELDDYDNILFLLQGRLQFPVFVKPAQGGSSIGVARVNAPDQLKAAMQTAFAHDTQVIVEQAVTGQEVECAVLGNRTPVCSLPGEIVSCNEELYDYDAKYNSGDASRLLIPAPLPPQKLDEMRELALRAFRVMGCEGLSRVDFFVEEGTGHVLLNEINTMPGFTPISMYPKLMEAMGIPFPELCHRLVLLALERAGL